MATSVKQSSIIRELIERAHSPTTAQSIYSNSIDHRPLFLRPTSTADQPLDARQARQRVRAAREKEKKRKRLRPSPLSAKQKRALCLYDIPKEQQKWEIFEPLHKMWLGYIRKVLGLGQGRKVYLDNKNAGPLLAAADFHGALLKVSSSRCISHVGIKGIVAKETKGTFEIITKENKLKIIPKEYSIFGLQIPLEQPEASPQHLSFELYGSQLIFRPAERATRKLKMHLPADI